ncbi:MAG: glycosyltransferase family 9 protein [Simkaniaceae bacterium]|nr:glycosyltransferase family 9 protein [Simkaniaceae bacterium]
MKKTARKILIVKTSSLGDIFHTLPLLPYLRQDEVDWIVKPQFKGAVERLVHECYTVDDLPKKGYDIAIDLQGNCRSLGIMMRIKAADKVGFGRRSIPEWPSLLATSRRFEVDLTRPITEQYLSLLQQAIPLSESAGDEKITYPLTLEEEEEVKCILSDLSFPVTMVCPLSTWENKQLDPVALVQLLKQKQGPFLFVMKGKPLLAEALCRAFPGSKWVGELKIPVWQRLIENMALVISADSSALHLAALTETPTLSFFGPSSSEIYAPQGKRHKTIQGFCPYGQSFVKRCKKLRTCPTGACLKALSPQQILEKST